VSAINARFSRKKEGSLPNASLCVICLLVLVLPAISKNYPSSKISIDQPVIVGTITMPKNAPGEMSRATKADSMQSAPSVVNTSLTVGSVPNGIAFDPATGNLYVANFGPGTLSVVNGSTNSVVATVNLNFPVSPWDVGYDPDNGNIYVSDTKNGAVSVVDTESNTVLSAVAVGDDMLSGDHDDRPNGVVFDPFNNYMYIAMYGSGYLAEIDTSQNVLIANAPVGQNAFVNSGLWGLAFDPANCNFYASNEVDDTLTVVSGASNTLVSSIDTGRSPNGVAVDSDLGPNYGNVLVANYAANTVSVINGSSNTVIDTIRVGENPDGIAFDSASGDFYVANYGDGSVSVINGSSYEVIDTLTVGSGASGVAYDQLNGDVYVADSNIGAVSIISTGDIVSNGTASQQYSAANCVLATTTNSTSTTSVGTSVPVSTSTITSLSSSTSTASTNTTSPSITTSSNSSTVSQYTTAQERDVTFPATLAVGVIFAIIVSSVVVLRKRPNGRGD
jgi:YVTN family beta-propeller protein